MTNKSVTQKIKVVGTAIHAEDGRVIGQVVAGALCKHASARKHFLHTPPAIAFDLYSIHEAERAGAEYADVLDTDSGIHYRASLSLIWDKGRKFNYGYGDQIYLTLDRWQASTDSNNTDTPAQGYTESTATSDEDEVKPLPYTSRAPKGVKWERTGKRTMKQLSLFGRRK